MRQLQVSIVILVLGMAIPAHGQVTTYCCDATAEAQYLADLATIVPSATPMAESFESAPWVPSHTAVQLSATNQGITWSRSGHGIRTSTGGGDVHEGSYLFYAIQLAMPFHPVPDGFTLTSDGTNLHGIGGWFRGQGQASKLAFTLDGDSDRVNFTGEEATVSDWKFLGFIDTNAFMTVDILTADEVGNETTIFFADDFNIAASSSSVENDFDGDATSDIMWRHNLSDKVYFWKMNSSSIESSRSVAVLNDPAWEIAGTGDYDGDGSADMIWRHGDTGQLYFWRMNGGEILSSASIATVSDSNWKVVGNGDHNGDGKSDLLWRHDVTGKIYFWQMNGAVIDLSTSVAVLSDLNWEIISNGDVDGDGRADLLWLHQITGRIYLWSMSGGVINTSAGVSTVSDLNWQVVGDGDYDGDGLADLMWKHAVSGKIYFWKMNGSEIAASSSVAVLGDLNWSIYGDGDYDGNGNADLLWRHDLTGQIYVWSMTGSTIDTATKVATQGDMAWQIINAE